MLRPQDGPTRERKSLTGLWDFALDPAGDGRGDGWWRGALRDASQMPVPARYNDIVPDTAVRDNVGDAWYQLQVWVPPSWAGDRVVLRFDSATHRAVVNYAGLHRTVWLYRTPQVYVSDVTVLSGLDGTTGTVDYQVEVIGALATTVSIALLDAAGTRVARGDGPAGSLTVPNVRRWQPGQGYLYSLEVSLLDSVGEVLDSTGSTP